MRQAGFTMLSPRIFLAACRCCLLCAHNYQWKGGPALQKAFLTLLKDEESVGHLSSVICHRQVITALGN